MAIFCTPQVPYELLKTDEKDEADNEYVDISKQAKMMGLTLPIYVSKEIYEKYLIPPVEVKNEQDVEERINGLLEICRAVMSETFTGESIEFKMYFLMNVKNNQIDEVNAYLTIRQNDEYKFFITITSVEDC